MLNRNSTSLQNRNLIAIGIPVLLFIGLIALINSPFLYANNTLDLAISVDVLLTVPFIYFLLIRKSEIPNTTVVPVMLLGLAIGSYFLPEKNQTYLDLFKNWGVPIIELFVFVFVIHKVRKVIKVHKSLKASTPDFYDTLKNACQEILPKKMALFLATEIAVCYYGFMHWKPHKITDHEFTYHKNSGTLSLCIAFILIIAIETVTLHLLLLKWNHTATWIVTGLSLYTIIQVFGFAKAVSQRPITLEEEFLNLRYSIINEVTIPYTNIEAVILSKKELEKNNVIKSLSPFGSMESHNVIIHVKKESSLKGLYGLKQSFKIITFYVDQPQKFKEQLENIIPQASFR